MKKRYDAQETINVAINILKSKCEDIDRDDAFMILIAIGAIEYLKDPESYSIVMNYEGWDNISKSSS